MSKGKWSDDLDSALAEIDSLTTENIRLHKALEELTTAAENECKFDTVLRKALSPYCEAARIALGGKG